MTIHRPTRWRLKAAVLTAAAAAAAVTPATVPVLTASAALASAPRPSISSVSFTGTTAPAWPRRRSPSPAPTSVSRPRQGPRTNTTSCGPYTANRKVYSNKLYFTDDANFEAGFSTSGGADCAGIIVVSWSPAKVVLQFGNAYGTFDHRYLTNGDGYAISVKTTLWGGAVSGLG
jgi:hypothetical protein